MTEINDKIRSTIQEIQADADRRIAELQRLEQTTATQVAELALSTQQRAEQAEQAALQAELQEQWAKFTGTGPAYFESIVKNNIDERQTIAEAIQILLGLPTWQIDARTRATGAIITFCRQAFAYEGAFASRAEFRLTLISTIYDFVREVNFFPNAKLDRHSLTEFMALFRVRKIDFDVAATVDHALGLGPLPAAAPAEVVTDSGRCGGQHRATRG